MSNRPEWFDERRVDGWITRDEVVRLRRGFDAEVTPGMPDEDGMPDSIRARPLYIAPAGKLGRPTWDEMRFREHERIYRERRAEMLQRAHELAEAVRDWYEDVDCCSFCYHDEGHGDDCPVEQLRAYDAARTAEHEWLSAAEQAHRMGGP